MEPIKIQPKTKRLFLFAGVILLVFGASLTVVSAVPVSNLTPWFDQTFQVQAFGYYTQWGAFQNFLSNDVLHISFDVSGEGNIDFWVMNETNFMKFSSGQAFEYYPGSSAPGVTVRNVDLTPPTDQKIYFVWDNAKSLNTQTIHATIKIEYQRQLLPTATIVVGLLLLFTGLAFLGLGFRPPTITSQTNTARLLKKQKISGAF